MKLRTNKPSPETQLTASAGAPSSCYCLTLLTQHMKFGKCLLPLPSRGTESPELMLYEMALSMTLLCLFRVSFFLFVLKAKHGCTCTCSPPEFVKISVAKLPTLVTEIFFTFLID